MIEIERREVPPSPYYYRVMREEIKALSQIPGTTFMQPVTKREVWKMIAKPIDGNSPAFFILDRLD